MVSYSNTGYENDFFDVSDVYFNSTSQSSGSAVDLDELDARYLQKTGGTVSSNLIVSGSVDIKTALTLPIIGDVEDAIQGKQATISDNGLSTTKISGLYTTLTTLSTDILQNETDITTLNKNNIIYDSNEHGIKTVSNWESRTIPTTGNWRKIVYAPELNLFVSIKLGASDTSGTSGNIMTSSNGIDWEIVINSLGGCRDIVWSGGKFVIAHFALPGFSTSTDGKTWNSTAIQVASGNICITYSPDLNIFVSVENSGGVVKSIDDGLNWASITNPPNTNAPKSVVWSSDINKFVIVYRTGAERVAYSSNGDDWFNVIVSLNEWNDIAWSPQLELFVAVAETGDNRVMTSTDRINWIDGSIPLYLWESVEWSDLGFFIAIATDGFIAYSSDGFNWIDSVLTGGLRGGCWSRELGIFVIVGLDIIYTSSLKNRKPTNENIFNNEFNSIDEDGTWTFNALNTNSILLNGSSVSTLISDKQDKLTNGANITIEGDEISCDLTAGTNINITSGVISTTGLQNELTTGANITIEGDEISCDLTAGTNIDITSGVISTTGLQNELTTGANITIEGDEISCDLTAGTNINITSGVISTTGLATTTELGTKQDEIDNTTDLNVKTLTTEGNITCGGIVIDPNRPCFCAYASSSFYSSGPQTLEYNNEFFDTTNSYDTTTYEYTIPITGNYFFYYSFVWVGESGCVVRLDKNNIQQDRVILSVNTNNGNHYYGFASNDTIGARSTMLLRCDVNDKIRIYLEGGQVRSFGFNGSARNSFGGFMIG